MNYYSVHSITMARPISIPDEDILRAAREVYLAKGVSTTTAAIAKRARISEGTLFHRYKTKEALFRAAMIDVDVREVIGSFDLDARVGRSTLEGELVDLATKLVSLYRLIIPGLLMLGARGESAAKSPRPHLTKRNPAPLRAVKRLAKYFAAEMRAKRMRSMNSEVVARVFIGGLWHYVFFETLNAHHGEPTLPEETFVRSHVDLLLHGLAIEIPSPRRTARRT